MNHEITSLIPTVHRFDRSGFGHFELVFHEDRFISSRIPMADETDTQTAMFDCIGRVVPMNAKQQNEHPWAVAVIGKAEEMLWAATFRLEEDRDLVLSIMLSELDHVLNPVRVTVETRKILNRIFEGR